MICGHSSISVVKIYLPAALCVNHAMKKSCVIRVQKFQDAMSRVDVMSDYLMHTLFGSIVPIYDFHCGLLKELDQRLAVWYGSYQYSCN